MMKTLERVETLETMTCGECGILFAAPATFWHDQRQSLRGWYCPNGHARVFMRREADHLRDQLTAKERELANTIARLDQAEARAADNAAQLRRVQRRVSNGVCPCCNRHFTHLERHMHGQHPDWQAADPALVTCRYCQQQFLPRGIRIHIARMHRGR